MSMATLCYILREADIPSNSKNICRIRFSVLADPFYLHWSCSPINCGVNSQGGATPMQAKWIKLDVVKFPDTKFIDIYGTIGEF